MSRW
jgi:hypothetical protein